MRYDDDAEFGSHTSVKIAAAWQITEWNTTLRGNYANGFKAPTLYQLYSAYSNPVDDLKPETAHGWEIGFDKTLFDDRLTASLTWFERRTKNQIDYLSCYGEPSAAGCAYRAYGYYVNLDRTKAQGLEAALTANITDALKFTANYTNMSARDRTTGQDLARRPQIMAGAALTWTVVDGLNLGTSVAFTGKRFDDAAEATEMGEYATVGLFGDYMLDKTWQIYGRIDNLFNDRTERVFGYGTEGIAASFGIRAHI